MKPTVINRDQHAVSRKQMSPEVLKVLYRLHRTGHLAYLCGGGVRDLLLGRKIDDFDVATDAEPRSLKKVFGNCRLIGRRFRIAHIMFKGGKIIEVSTFRKKGEEEEEATDDGNSLLIKRDNTFGSPAEDAFRRDFTINGLYYNVADFSIIDYVDGRADLHARLIRCIGEPNIRFQEDPIRILRGIRLAATLDFQVEESTWEAMKRQCHHIMECPASRIREEIMKILRRKNSRKGFELLAGGGILEHLLPRLDEFRLACLKNEPTSADPLLQHLGVIDDLRSKGSEFTDSLLLATLTASPVLSSFERFLRIPMWPDGCSNTWRKTSNRWPSPGSYAPTSIFCIWPSDICWPKREEKDVGACGVAHCLPMLLSFLKFIAWQQKSTGLLYTVGSGFRRIVNTAVEKPRVCHQ